jgi:hypothetical protein
MKRILFALILAGFAKAADLYVPFAVCNYSGMDRCGK